MKPAFLADWETPMGAERCVFRFSYGSGLNDPMPFVLTVTLPYVARDIRPDSFTYKPFRARARLLLGACQL
jgi:hypothetical protein